MYHIRDNGDGAPPQAHKHTHAPTYLRTREKRVVVNKKKKNTKSMRSCGAV